MLIVVLNILNVELLCQVSEGVRVLPKLQRVYHLEHVVLLLLLLLFHRVARRLLLLQYLHEQILVVVTSVARTASLVHQILRLKLACVRMLLAGVVRGLETAHIRRLVHHRLRLQLLLANLRVFGLRHQLLLRLLSLLGGSHEARVHGRDELLVGLGQRG